MTRKKVQSRFKLFPQAVQDAMTTNNAYVINSAM